MRSPLQPLYTAQSHIEPKPCSKWRKTATLRVLTAFLAVFWTCFSTLGVNVVINVRDITSGIVQNRTVSVTLIKPVLAVAGPWLIAGDSVSKLTDSTGICTFSNMLTIGEYRCDISGTPGRSFPFSLAVTNGTYNLMQLLGTNVAVEMFYDTVQIDSLLAGLGGTLIAGTNIIVITNAAHTWTIHGTATNGSGVTLNGQFVKQGTNVLMTTNGSTVTVNGLTDTNIINGIVTASVGFWKTNAAQGNITNNGSNVRVKGSLTVDNAVTAVSAIIGYALSGTIPVVIISNQTNSDDALVVRNSLGVANTRITRGGTNVVGAFIGDGAGLTNITVSATNLAANYLWVTNIAGGVTNATSPVHINGQLTVGNSGVPKFIVTQNGNIALLNNVVVSFPSTQGMAGSVLQNNGSGAFNWNTGYLTNNETRPVTLNSNLTVNGSGTTAYGTTAILAPNGIIVSPLGMVAGASEFFSDGSFQSANGLITGTDLGSLTAVEFIGDHLQLSAYLFRGSGLGEYLPFNGVQGLVSSDSTVNDGQGLTTHIFERASDTTFTNDSYIQFNFAAPTNNTPVYSEMLVNSWSGPAGNQKYGIAALLATSTNAQIVLSTNGVGYFIASATNTTWLSNGVAVARVHSDGGVKATALTNSGVFNWGGVPYVPPTNGPSSGQFLQAISGPGLGRLLWTNANVFITSNLFTTNLFVDVAYITNLHVSQAFISNLFADYSYLTNLFTSNAYITNLYSSNAFITNLYSSNAFLTNLYSSNAYITNLYVSNAFVTNLFVDVSYITNLYVSNAFITNLQVLDFRGKTVLTTNLYSSNAFFTNVYVTSGLSLSNVSVPAVLMANAAQQVTNVTLGSGLSLVGTTLSATGSGGTVTSVGASGPAGFTWSSPVTGSGTLTATTPGIVVTNGEDQAIAFSNSLTVDATHTLFANKNLQTVQTDYTTNSNPVTPDFALGYQLFQTNAAFTFLAPANVDTTKTLAQTTVVVVTNSTAAAVLATLPANVRAIGSGSFYVTNMSSFTFFQYGQKITNCYATPWF